MKSKIKMRYLVAVFNALLLIAWHPPLSAQQTAQELLLEEMIARIVKNYPSITLATLEVERSRQEFAKIESQLGWVFSAQTGVGHDVTFIDSPTDRFDASAKFGRSYESGVRFNVGANYAYEDSSNTFSPLVPNPAERAGIDFSWRVPLGRGEDNPAYHQGMVLAESALQGQTANQTFIIDNLIQQGINLYYDAAETYMRILDAEKAIERAQKLKDYNERNARLGLAEKKDLLIVQAQIDRLVSARDSLRIAWSRQRAEINRLMGESSTRDFVPSPRYQDIVELNRQQELLTIIYGRDPQIQQSKSRLKSAEANLALARDSREEQLDVVLSLGARAAKGDTASGSFSQEEWAGRAGIEYQYEFDKRGFDSVIYQAMLDRQLAEVELNKLQYDKRYLVESLVQQINDNKNAITSNKKRVDIETLKLQDAVKRYREGRADTREVVEFENDLFASNLVYENQLLQLARTYATLNLLLGRIWQPDILTSPSGLSMEHAQ